MFWPFRGYFDNLPNGMYSLFSVMNGDSVGDVFTGTSMTRLMLGQCYTYCFTILGMCVLQNLNMICVEDSYLTAKYASNFDWLTGKNTNMKQPEQ